MKKSIVAPLAFGLAAALSLAATPAAHAEPVEPDASINLSITGVLTLPDADGVRDATTVNIASDVATVVVPRIYSPDASLVRELPAVELVGGGAAASIGVDLTSIVTAGVYRLEVSPEAGAPASAELVVGSGRPTSVSLSLSHDSIWSWSKAKINSTVATVTATDETKLQIPFTGTVKTTNGKKSVSANVVSKTGSPAKTRITGASVGAGKATVTVTAKGAGASKSASTSLTVKSVSVTGTKVTASHRTLYPAKDGYLDAATLTVASTTTTGAAVPGAGSVKIIRAGKTVRSWTLTSSKKWTAKWDGKVHGKVVPGTYTVKVAVKGPEGASKTASTTISVKAGKLTTKTAKKTYKASTILKTYTPLDYYGDGYCEYDDTTFDCIGYDGYYGDDTVSLIAEGATTVPSAVRNAYKYGGAKVKMTLNAPAVVGQAAWGYGPASDPTAKLTKMAVGNSSPGWYVLPTSSTKLGVTAATGEYSFFFAKSITVEYRYKAMVK